VSFMRLKEYAQKKGLPPDFLAGLGVREESQNLLIPYYTQEGRVYRTRYRCGDHRWWSKGEDLIPYGLDRLVAYEGKNIYLFLAEGESDTQTLWLHNFPALGIPGATTFQPSWASDYLQNFPWVYLCPHNDSGREAYMKKVTAGLAEGGFVGFILVVRLPKGIKDINEIYLIDPDSFPSRFRKLVQEAEIWRPAERVEEKESIPARRGKSPKATPQIAMAPDLIEIVKDGRDLAFLLAGGKIAHQIEGGIPHPDYEKIFGPAIPVGDILSQDGDGVRLLRNLEVFFQKYVELPPELPPLIVALHVIQSFLQEKMSVLPYLYVSGPYGSGKTRLLEVIASLSFRPLFTTSLTPAAIYRTVEMWRPTLLVDEFGTSKEILGETLPILNSRYKRGLTVIRCRPKTFETETFDVFGPTVIAGPKIQASLAHRSLSGVMAKATRALPRYIDQKEARALRCRLLALRLKTYQAPLPEAPRLADGRLDELVSAYHSVLLLVDPTRDQEFRDAIAGQTRRHQAEEQDSVEADLAEALSTLEPDGECFITVTEVVEALGWNTEDHGALIRVGGLLGRSLGLERARPWREGKRVTAYLWDEKRIQRFIDRYSSLHRLPTLSNCPPEIILPNQRAFLGVGNVVDSLQNKTVQTDPPDHPDGQSEVMDSVPKPHCPQDCPPAEIPLNRKNEAIILKVDNVDSLLGYKEIKNEKAPVEKPFEEASGGEDPREVAQPSEFQYSEEFSDLVVLLQSGKARGLPPLKISPAVTVTNAGTFLCSYLRNLSHPILKHLARRQLEAFRQSLEERSRSQPIG
jgi:hypothetical protein